MPYRLDKNMLLLHKPRWVPFEGVVFRAKDGDAAARSVADGQVSAGK